ncbi:MAG: sodium-translocating pyrophosphatase [Candidatus Hodarchaeota archaeon]
MITFYFLIPITLACSFVVVLFIFNKIRKYELKFEQMHEIHERIEKGAQTYLKRQSKTLFTIILILFVPVGLTGMNFLKNQVLAVIITGVCFCLGSLSSMMAAFLSMDAATRTNVLVAEISATNPNKGFRFGFYGGLVNGILNIAMFLTGLWILFMVTGGNVYLIVGYSFGGSITALLCQVGGGVYTKSADMGADLVGKFEIGMDEDDPRNPAVIADAVGDNVGDCAGRGADLFESALSNTIGGMVLGVIIFTISGNPIFIISDITLLCSGVFSAMLSSQFLKYHKETNPSRVVWIIFFISTIFNFGVLYLLNLLLFGKEGYLLFLCCMTGLFSSLLSIIATLYYTDVNYKPTHSIAEASQQGAGVSVVAGLATGYEATIIPLVGFGISIITSYAFGYQFGRLYALELGIDPIAEETFFNFFCFVFAIWGINMASVSSDTMISTILSFDTFGPIVDNAEAIASMAKDETTPGLMIVLEHLDATGNTTKAISKGFALVCAGYEGITLFLTFVIDTETLAGVSYGTYMSYFLITNPLIVFGLLIGCLLPYLFASQIMKAVGKGASEMVHEVRRQFQEIPGLKEGTATADFNKCVDISTKFALRAIAKPVFIIVVIPVISGILLGPIFVGSLLIGNLIGCLIVGLFMSLTGAAFDNAKKGIESGMFGGKGTHAHKASIIGDVIGDPLKDSAGPSMNIEITTINTLALTFLPLFVTMGLYGLFPWLWAMFPF